jgi:hypothetical protein
LTASIKARAEIHERLRHRVGFARKAASVISQSVAAVIGGGTSDGIVTSW